MDLRDEFADAKQWVETELRFDRNRFVSLFETTIRVNIRKISHCLWWQNFLKFCYYPPLTEKKLKKKFFFRILNSGNKNFRFSEAFSVPTICLANKFFSPKPRILDNVCFPPLASRQPQCPTGKCKIGLKWDFYIIKNFLIKCWQAPPPRKFVVF